MNRFSPDLPLYVDTEIDVGTVKESTNVLRVYVIRSMFAVVTGSFFSTIATFTATTIPSILTVRNTT